MFALSRLSRNHLGNSSQRTSGQARWHDAYHASYTRTSSYIRSACGCILFFASFRCIRLRNSFPPHVLLRYCGIAVFAVQHILFGQSKSQLGCFVETPETRWYVLFDQVFFVSSVCVCRAYPRCFRNVRYYRTMVYNCLLYTSDAADE